MRNCATGRPESLEDRRVAAGMTGKLEFDCVITRLHQAAIFWRAERQKKAKEIC
jgi:hypothetical protein